MEKSEKLEQRSKNYGRKFFAFLHKKVSVPSGCVFTGIRYVTALARMNNHLSVGCALRNAPRKQQRNRHIMG